MIFMSKVLEFFKDKRVDMLIILALFLLAFAIRSIPNESWNGVYGFDSYWAARNIKYMITGEKTYPYVDTNTDYPYGRSSQILMDAGWWLPNAFAYKITAFLTGTQGFNYDLFGTLFGWAVVIAGALAAPFMYLLGKEMFGRKMGILAGLFIAVSNQHIFYSMFGHAENDALGLTLMFAVLWLFVSTIKKKNAWYLGATSLLFTWLSITWVAYKAVVVLAAGTICAYFGLSYIMRKMKYIGEENNDDFKKWMCYSFSSFLAAPIIVSLMNLLSFAGTDIFVNKGGDILPFVGFTLLFVAVIEFLDKKPRIAVPKSLKEFFSSNLMIQAGCVALLVLVIGFVIYGSGMFFNIIHFGGYTAAQGNIEERPDYEQRMLTTIAEQNTLDSFVANQNGIALDQVTITMRFGFLQGEGFGLFIWFAVMGAVIAVLKAALWPFIKKRINIYDIMMAGLLCYGLFFLTERLQTFFFLSGIITFGAAYLFNELMNAANSLKSKINEKATYISVGIMCIALIFALSNTVNAIESTKSVGVDMSSTWEEAIDFINTPDIPTGSVIAAWWDYGHWINYFNGDKVNVNLDNIQDRPDIIYTVAKAFTHTGGTKCIIGIQERDCPTSEAELEKAEIESLSYLKPLKPTHILIDSEIIGGITGGKGQALKVIANKIPYTGNDVGCMQAVPGCGKTADGGVECNFGQSESMKLTAVDWSIVVKGGWPGKFIQSDQMTTRVLGKEVYGYPQVFMSALSCGQFYPSANAPALNMFMERLFFNDKSLKHVKNVFDNGNVVIYEIDWDDIPDPEQIGLENVLPPV